MKAFGPGPTAPYLLVNSIGRSAADVTFDPGILEPWIRKVEDHVAAYGMFYKPAVIYFPFSPPPAVWDYKCKKCLWWKEPRQCKVVRDDIDGGGWCVLWVPPSNYKPFTYPGEFVRGEW